MILCAVLCLLVFTSSVTHRPGHHVNVRNISGKFSIEVQKPEGFQA